MKGPGHTPLHIVAFLDGGPGHEKQTCGILNAMGRITGIDPTYRSISPGGFTGTIKDWILYAGSRMFGPPSGVDPTPIDIIIGTGTRTHIPMLLLKRISGARAVICMKPAIPLIRDFDLCFIPQHDRVSPASNIVVTIGPPNTAVYQATHSKNQGLILVGGIDPKSHHWRHQEIVEQIRSILLKHPTTQWTISSSPRTPPETIQLLMGLTPAGNVRIYRSEETPAGWIEEQYAASHSVWVSADSVSMVHEAITAGCRVGILSVRWKRSDNKIKRSIDYLIDNDWVTPFARWQQDQTLKEATHRLDEAGRCAREILKRWWPNRLK